MSTSADWNGYAFNEWSRHVVKGHQFSIHPTTLVGGQVDAEKDSIDLRSETNHEQRSRLYGSRQVTENELDQSLYMQL
jgi:hypothetical protein